MSLSADTRLGPYEITGPLGSGGMGEVYRARDPRLGRDVAIKVLPSDFSADPERLQRFEQEARAAAALNHPNILAVYDISQHEGMPFIVSELLEGETLRERLAQGSGLKARGEQQPLPVRKAVDYAVQIANGLAAAHEKGIVHRDLKPENLFVTRDGRVKILDFGLAKLTQAEAFRPAEAGRYVPDGGVRLQADLSALPTTPPRTTPGLVLGTVGYMAPEQVRGLAADHRSDIFAFGAILYEMLSGRRAFQGATTADTMSAILDKHPPDLPLAEHHIPTGLGRIVDRCLEKIAAARFQNASDLAFALEALDTGSGTHIESAVGRRTSRERRWIFVAAASLLVAMLTWPAAQYTSRTTAPNPPVTRLELSLPPDVELFTGSSGPVALSPDGTRVAFVGVLGGVRQVYVRRLDQFDAVPLRGTEAVDSCFFAPDGNAIGFIGANGTLNKVALADGLVVTLTTNVDFNLPATWGPDDRITFSRAGVLWQMPASGGSPTQLTKLDSARDELVQAYPAVVEGGRTILFTSSTTGSRYASRIEAVSPASGARHVVVESGIFPRPMPSGHLIFFRDGALLAAPFDADRLELTGTPARVLGDLGVDITGAPIATVSSSGSLVYQSTGTAASRLVWVTRQGLETPVTDSQRPYQNPRLAPDGLSALVEVTGDLWIQDTVRSTFTRLTSDQMAARSFPVWTPDGKRVIFRTRTNLRWIDTDGSRRSQEISGTSPNDFPGSVSPDGNMLAFARLTPETSLDVYVLSLRGEPNPRAVVNTPAFEGGAEFSPDGRWMAYVSNETGQNQVYVRPFPGPDRR